MQNSIKIPYDVDSYEKIVREDYSFVDKTQFIESLEQYKTPVFLRPRGFGKSLWCSILECYYDINKGEAFYRLFGETYIGKHPTSEKNKYLVMRFNFTEMAECNSIKEVQDSFNSNCFTTMKYFLSYYSLYFGEYIASDESPGHFLYSIVSHIDSHKLPKLFIIIDGVDTFTNHLTDLYTRGLNDNPEISDAFIKHIYRIIKSGLEEGRISRIFFTGLVPITFDELSAGFNIGEDITLEKSFVSMLGFTQEEVDKNLDTVFADNKFYKTNLKFIRVLLENYYSGYQFIADSPKLYNPMMLHFFMKEFVSSGGKIPIDFIDDNLKTDINWIKRLTIREENTKEMLSKLIFDNELRYDQNMVRSKFNMNQFFEKDFYPVSLFYLGMLTIKDDYNMGFPNQTMKTIFADYFNIVEKIEVSSGYTDYFIQFMKDLDIEKLFAGYWKTYIGQIPAQAMDKANDNFFRTTFYELCNRYLSTDFVFNIEVNYPSGRSDWELLGKYHTEFKNIKYIIEFKHFSKEEARKKKVASLKKPFDDDVIQVNGYAADILRDFPEYKMSKFIIYTIGAEKFKFYRVE